jgi:hypothetical protein
VLTARTACEGDCEREPLLGSFTVLGAELRSSVHAFVTYQLVEPGTS